jgi:hypothetical protein
MTGVMEVASLALAVLPIIISVTEHYSSAVRAVKRYRQFSSEIERLSTVVKIQRTIFHGEIQSLLSSHIGWAEAGLLLQNTNDQRWKDNFLDESISKALGNNRESFLELVGCINAELSELEVKLSAFEEVTEPAKKV